MLVPVAASVSTGQARWPGSQPLTTSPIVNDRDGEAAAVAAELFRCMAGMHSAESCVGGLEV